jgi:predicted GTPase
MWTVRRINEFYDQEIMVQYGKNHKTVEKAVEKAIKLRNAVVFHWNKPVAIVRAGHLSCAWTQSRNGVQTQ